MKQRILNIINYMARVNLKLVFYKSHFMQENNGLKLELILVFKNTPGYF